MLRRLHAGPPIAGRFDPFRVVEAYAALARGGGVPLPPAYEPARAIAGRIEAALGAAARWPCHNDLLAANFVRVAQRLWIVDWEYAGMGDPAFDLANFAVNNGLDEDGDRELLEAYGAADPARAHPDALHVGLPRGDVGGVQQALSELDFDFAGYADEHFARLEQAAAEPRFRAALGPSRPG